MLYDRIAMDTDGGLGARARLGLIVLRTDQTVEHEGRQVMAALDGVALYHARIDNDFTITPETLMAMKPRIPAAAALLPAAWAFSAVGFACTSGATVIGDGPIAEAVGAVHPAAAVTNPMAAAVAAFDTLGIKRVGVVTPYAPAVNAAIAAELARRGLEVPALVSFEEPDDNIVARITPAAIARAVERVAGMPGVEGVFVSCTSIRTVAHAAGLEARVGKPVTASNHALYWHMLRCAGIADALPQFGALYGLPLATRAAA